MKKILVALLLSAVGIAGRAQSAPVQTAPEFAWGVSGHVFVQESYRPAPTGVSIEAQLTLVQELGARWYRVDWLQDVFEKQPAAYDSLVRLATRRGLKLLPILFPSIPKGATNAEAEAASFRYGKAMAQRYKSQISHWELLNERDIGAMISKGEKTRDGQEWPYGTPDGDKPEHYEESRYQESKAQILGLARGVRAGNPGAKTMVNAAGWLHYGSLSGSSAKTKSPSTSSPGTGTRRWAT